MKYKLKQNSIYILLMIIFLGCTTTAPYSQVAYEQSTSIKATTLFIMSRAVEPYASHKQSVDNLLLEGYKAYEYAKARPKNEEATKQWGIILNPKRNSLAGFMARWKSAGTLGQGFIIEARKEISRHFDIISTVEARKQRI
jgi:hypothetical protein